MTQHMWTNGWKFAVECLWEAAIPNAFLHLASIKVPLQREECSRAGWEGHVMGTAAKHCLEALCRQP